MTRTEKQMSPMRSLFLAIGLCFGLGAPAFALDAPTEIAGATTVNWAGVVDLVEKETNLIILDVRIPEEYRDASIDGAVNLVNTEVTPETLAKVVPSKSTPVLIYCNGLKCGRAADAVKKTLGFGYSNVYYYALGMAEWKDKSMPLVRHQ